MKGGISRRDFLKRTSQVGLLAATAHLASLAAACAPAAAPAAPTQAPAKPASGGAAAPAKAPGAVTLRMSTAISPEVPSGKGTLKFAELVKQKSDGKLAIDPYLSGTLYDEPSGIRAVLEGSHDIAQSVQANMGAFTEACFWLDMPFIFRSKAGLRKVMAGPIFQDLAKTLEEKTNLKVVMFSENLVRDICTARKQVKVPNDVKGMKIRTPGTPVEVATWKAWGANPTAIPWLEVYTALSQNLVDGEGVQAATLESVKHFEVIKYVTEVKYNYVIMFSVMRADKFKALPADFQKILLDSGKETAAWESQMEDDFLPIIKQNSTKNNGVTWYTPTADELKQWYDSAPGIWDQFKDKVPPDFIKKVLDGQV